MSAARDASSMASPVKPVGGKFHTPEGKYTLNFTLQGGNPKVSRGYLGSALFSACSLAKEDGEGSSELCIAHSHGNELRVYTSFSKTTQLYTYNFPPTALEFRHDGLVEGRTELLVGFRSGDLLVVNLNDKKDRTHHNKEGIISPACVKDVCWVPKNPDRFVSAHKNGTLLVFDRSRADGKYEASPAPDVKGARGRSGPQNCFSVHKPVYKRGEERNPVARWQICDGPLNAISFSSNGLFLATAGRDGVLRVFDFEREECAWAMCSHFGALLCLAWSPDDFYIATGGEDDMVSVFYFSPPRSPEGSPPSAVIARCPGHHSWVSSVAFDPSLCDGFSYRIVSGGQDTRLLVWDLSSYNLSHPRHQHTTPCGSPRRGKGGAGKKAGSRTPTETVKAESYEIDDAPPSGTVPLLEPLVSHRAHQTPITRVAVVPDGVLTACEGGMLRLWARPPPVSEMRKIACSDGDSEEDRSRDFSPPAGKGGHGTGMHHQSSTASSMATSATRPPAT